jgi:tetratricopeptide (TPR) repeat protein
MTRPLIIKVCLTTVSSATCVVLMVACSNRHAVDPAPTIADLSAAPGPASIHAAAADGREKAIAGYRGYLERYPDTPRHDTIARRLADLLVESAADMQAEEAVSGEFSPQQDAAARKRYGEAIAIYQQLLDKYPADPDTAELLYQLSRAYEETGQAELAIKVIDRLLADGSSTNQRLYSDAQFRRGELLFGEGAYPAAALAYRAVVELGESVPAYEQALYKLGWSLFKQEQYDAALNTFFTLLDRKFPRGKDPATHLTTLSRVEQEQIADVFRGVNMSFSHQAGVESVAAYFKRHGSRIYEDQVYLALAEFYVGQDQVSEAARTWLALAARTPRSSETPQLYIRVIEIYRRAGFRQRVVETETVFVRRYGLSSDFWAQHSPRAFPDVLQQLQASLIDLAQHYHARAQKEHRADDYRAAEQWYRDYLDAFGDTERAAEMNFLLAELLYDNGSYLQAIDEYERTAWARGEHPQAAEAGRAAMHAYAQYLKQPGAEDREAVSARAIAGATRFIAAYPDDPAATAILAQTGADLLDRKKFQEAIRMSERLLEQEAPLPPALLQTAWSILAQAQFEQGDYRAAEHAYRQALQLTDHDDPRWSALNNGQATAIYKQAQQQQVEGDGSQAVVLYLKAADTSSDSSIQPNAQYDAATALLALEAWQDAARILEQFRDDHAEHPLQGKVTQKLAYAYDRSGRHLSAAAEYLKLGQSRVAAGLQREALVRAAELFAQAGKDQDAISTLELYLSRFPNPADEAADAMQQLADLESASGNAVRRRHWLGEIIELDRSASDAHTRTLAAHATLELAEKRLVAFRRIRLVKPLQKSLASKLHEMKLALKAFETAIEYGVAPVTSAATHNIATMYDELSQELLASERPGKLGVEELTQYELLLEEQAAPFEQQAIEIYASNVRRTSGARGDRWVEKSQQRLDELRPDWLNSPNRNTGPVNRQHLKKP